MELDGTSLTPELVARVAADDGPSVRLAPASRERMEETRRAVEEMVAGEAPVYGVNTGFGRLSDERISRDQVRELQRNLIRSHACGVGEPLDRRETRALLLLRANVLARGRSGVRPVLADAVLALLNRGVHPVIPREGSVGASGDLAPAAHAALVLMGEGEAEVGGRRRPGDEALREVGLEPMRLEAKEGLALLNGTQAMTAVGVLSLLRAEGLVDVAELAGAVSLEGLRGSPDPFDAAVQRLRPHPGQEESARRLRGLLRDSEIRESHRYDDPRVQDAYSIRCMPQVHGAVRDAIAFVRRVLEVEINSATDNPLVISDGSGGWNVVSNGNFHGQPVAAALDQLAIALTTLAAISERRTDRLLNPDLSGLPAFLSPEPGLRSGMMLMQVTAAGQVASCRGHAVPASTGSIPTGAAKEDHVSMGMHAADQVRGVLDCLERVLSVELIAGVQAVEMHAPLTPGRGVRAGMEAVREVVPPLDEDRALAGDIGRAVELLRGDRLPALVERFREGG